MKERPILFNSSMVRAILDGRKSQTRRIVSPQPDQFGFWRYNSTAKCDDCGDHYRRAPKRCKCGCTLFKTVEYQIQKCLSECPCGQPGDRLWVKETFSTPFKGALQWVYKANEVAPFKQWTPSILMPRLFSRITLEITAVRVEQLQDISEEDAKAEGVSPEFEVDFATFIHNQKWNPAAASTCRLGYKHLWNEINGKGSWSSNPWVWVIEFKRVTP